MKPIKTMTAVEAFKKAVKKMKHEIGANGQYFTLLGWKSPANGQIVGPLLMTISGDAAIEVSRRGRFKDTFPAIADCYFPWVDLEK